jgi:hypothetical protein
MSALVSPSVFDRPLRPDLAAFFSLRCRASACATKPETPLVGVLADLARRGHG